MISLKVAVNSVLAVLVIQSIDSCFGQVAIPKAPDDYFTCYCQAFCELGDEVFQTICGIMDKMDVPAERQFVREKLISVTGKEFSEELDYNEVRECCCAMEEEERKQALQELKDSMVDRHSECCFGPDKNDDICNLYDEVMDTLLTQLEEYLDNETCKA